MFGGKNEDYDAYNEKASSKYDDYGTSETEVYSDDGLYEQTFTDNQTTLKKFFADKLDTDERLIWTGSMKNAEVPENIKSLKRKQNGFFVITAGGLLLLAGFCFWPFFIPGILLAALGFIISPKKAYAREMYALTNKRVLAANIWDTSYADLKDIYKVEHTMKDLNSGSVFLTTNNLYFRGKQLTSCGFRFTLKEINDPANVVLMVNKAVRGRSDEI